MEHTTNALVDPALADDNKTSCENSQNLLLEPSSSNSKSNSFKILNAHRILIKNNAINQRKEGKALLQSKILECREEIARCHENERILQSIFPEEIWTMILGNLDDWRDLANCAATSPFLERILTPTKREWLFGKVFPIIFNRLEVDDIRDLRLVCKQWCSGVDNNLEEINHTLKKTEIDETQEFLETSNELMDLNHTFSVPVHPESWGADDYNEDEIRDELKRHPRNPFISRSLTVMATDPEDEDIEDFSTELPIFLTDFGQHILHLSLVTDGQFEYRNSLHCYTTCVQSLSKCSMLRSLSITGRVKEKNEVTFPLEIDLLPEHRYLESIIVDMGYPCVLQFQDNLVEKYSSKLKQLCVQIWDSSAYHSMNWENLKELEVKEKITDGIFNSLMQIRAPVVQKLIVTVDKLNLEQLICLVKHFPGINFLKLRFSKEFLGFDDKQLLEISTNSLSNCARIETLQLDASCLEFGLSYNFLILFPFLRKIYLRVDAGKDKIKLKNPNYYPESDMFQISKLIWNHKDKRPMYKSDLWSRIDSLANVEIGRVNTVNIYKEDFETFEFYTREGYNRHKCDTQDLLKYHLKCLEIETERQKILKRDVLREHILGLKLNENLKKMDANDVFSEKIWKIILGHLYDNNDLLSCSKGSKYLANLLEDTKSQWLFEKAFPIFFSHLGKSDVLNCRAVCKSWSHGVNTYLENHFTVKDFEKDISFKTPIKPNGFNYTYRFYFPRDSELEFYHDRVEDDLKSHPRNPFIGRSVSLSLSYREQDPQEIDEFTKSFGKHIWHLSIVGERENKKQSFMRLRPKIYFRIVNVVLTNCPNIRSLYLSNIHIHWPHDGLAMMGIRSAGKLPDLQYLESFHMIGHNENGKKLQDNLLKKYGPQLRRVSTSVWSKGLCTSFEKLRELFISESDSDSWIDCLKDIEAPNLKELCICLDGKKSMLTTLVVATNNFPNINKLKLKLSNNFRGFSEEDVVNHTFGLFSPSGLTSLEVVTGRNYNISLDLVMFFPCLKRLTILNNFREVREDENKSFKIWNKKNVSFSESSSDDEKEDSSEIAAGENKDNQIWDKATTGVIQLPKRFWNQSESTYEPQLIENIWESNIWQILRFLEVLEIIVKTHEDRKASLIFGRGRTVEKYSENIMKRGCTYYFSRNP